MQLLGDISTCGATAGVFAQPGAIAVILKTGCRRSGHVHNPV